MLYLNAPAHPHITILLCINFERYIIVTKSNFHALIACHPALITIFNGIILLVWYVSMHACMHRTDSQLQGCDQVVHVLL